jgi:hypothetical protein
MPGIVDRLAAAEAACVLADDRAVLADDDTLGIGLDLDRPADGASGRLEIPGFERRARTKRG